MHSVFRRGHRARLAEPALQGYPEALPSKWVTVAEEAFRSGLAPAARPTDLQRTVAEYMYDPLDPFEVV